MTQKNEVRNESNEIHITRIYDASIQLVWSAWTDPSQVAQWWGPRGFSLTTHSKELKKGGHWHYTMHGPDGVDYPNKTHYLEVDPYVKLVYDHGANDDHPPLFRVTVLFSEHQGKTTMEMTMALATPEAAKETQSFIKKAGGNATWDRLAEYLEKETSGKEKFVINRTFAVSREVMFTLWTDPEHVSKWSPPTGFRMEFIQVNIKKGGSGFYFMTNDQGVKMFGKTSYLHIEKPSSIVYTQQFCDEQGRVTRHPMSPTWPETMLTTVTLNEEESGQTRVTLAWEPYGATTAEEIDTFVKAKGGMTQGWTGSFDKLEEFLAGIERT